MFFVLIAVIAIIVVLGGVGLIAKLIIDHQRKQAYLAELSGHGWTFVETPPISIAYGLNAPPFGIGGQRRVDDQVLGHHAGVPFTAFRYGVGSPAGHVLALRLDEPLPPAFVFVAGRGRAGVQGIVLQSGAWSVVAPDERWARQVGDALIPTMDALAARFGPVSASIDGENLVFTDVPREPDALRVFLDLAVPAVAAIAPLRSPWPVRVPAELSFYAYPDWTYRNEDSQFLDVVGAHRGGDNHRATDVVLGEREGLRAIGLVHRWQTTETYTTTDAEGRTQTHTRTVDHAETLCCLLLPFPFGDLNVNWGGGRKISFESEDFNRAWAVRAPNERFAYDIVHPRTMEYLQRTRPPGFNIQGYRMWFTVTDASPPTLEYLMQFALGFFARVPSFVWDNLGLPDAPPGLTAYAAR